MAAEPVTEQRAKAFLAVLPMIRRRIWMNEPVTDGEVGFLRMAGPKEFDLLRNVTYEEIIERLSPLRGHPEFGTDVELALSPRGEKWIRHALGIVRRVANEKVPEDEMMGEDAAA